MTRSKQRGVLGAVSVTSVTSNGQSGQNLRHRSENGLSRSAYLSHEQTRTVQSVFFILGISIPLERVALRQSLSATRALR